MSCPLKNSRREKERRPFALCSLSCSPGFCPSSSSVVFVRPPLLCLVPSFSLSAGLLLRSFVTSLSVLFRFPRLLICLFALDWIACWFVLPFPSPFYEVVPPHTCVLPPCVLPRSRYIVGPTLSARRSLSSLAGVKFSLVGQTFETCCLGFHFPVLRWISTMVTPVCYKLSAVVYNNDGPQGLSWSLNFGGSPRYSWCVAPFRWRPPLCAPPVVSVLCASPFQKPLGVVL